jgi:hypothetical protein
VLGLAGVSWALLLAPVLRHWQTPVAGASFLLTGGGDQWVAGVFARAWTWLAVIVSVFVFAGLLRRGWRVLLR